MIAYSDTILYLHNQFQIPDNIQNISDFYQISLNHSEHVLDIF